MNPLTHLTLTVSTVLRMLLYRNYTTICSIRKKSQKLPKAEKLQSVPRPGEKALEGEENVGSVPESWSVSLGAGSRSQ